MADDTAPMSGNPNRQDGALGEDWASGIDAALGSLSMDSGSGGAERHPEKRLKAVRKVERRLCRAGGRIGQCEAGRTAKGLW